MRRSLIVLLVMLLFAAPGLAQSTLSLDDCFLKASSRSAALIESKENIVVAEARYRQAISEVLPKVNFVVNQQYRSSIDFGRVEVPGGTAEDPASSTGGRGGTLGKNQVEGVIRVTQPIFQGFRDFLLLKAAQETSKASELTQQRTEEVLRESVATAYFQVLSYEKDLEVLQKTNAVLRDRISELRRFQDLGRSRESEVLTAESELYDSEATTRQTEGLEKASREALVFFVGEEAREAILEFPAFVKSKSSVDDLVVKAKERSDVKAAYRQIEAQKLTARAVSRERWPAITFEGNGYAFEDPHRNRDWDVLFRLNVPVFEGGAISNRRQEEDARLRSIEATAEELLRQVESDVRQASATLSATEKEILALKKLSARAQDAYEKQKADYELGVVTNLDVLNSIRRLQDAQRREHGATIARGLARLKLEIAVGGSIS